MITLRNPDVKIELPLTDTEDSKIENEYTHKDLYEMQEDFDSVFDLCQHSRSILFYCEEDKKYQQD